MISKVFSSAVFGIDAYLNVLDVWLEENLLIECVLND